MTERIEATVRVRGDAEARESFRRRANALLAADFPDASCRELHDREVLDWRVACAAGVPFPPFVAASVEHPALECTVEWREREGTARRATLVAGRLELAPDAGDAPDGARESHVVVRAAADGALRHAVVLERAPGADFWLGYLAAADRHAFVRCDLARRSVAFSDNLDPEWAWCATVADAPAAARLTPPEAMPDAIAERLHDVAERFAAEWLWFDAAPEPETAIERHRFAQYGFPVHPANLQSRKLKRVLVADADGHRLDAADADAAAAAALVVAAWGARPRS